MTQDKSISEHNSETGGNRRFRLPKLFADSNEASEEERAAESRRIADRAAALGVTLPAPILDDGAIAAANRPYEGEPRASVLHVAPEEIEALSAAKETAAQESANAQNSGFDDADDSSAESDLAPASAELASAESDVTSELARAKTLGISNSGIARSAVAPSHSATMDAGSESGEGSVLKRLDVLQSEMDTMSRLLNEICERGTAQDKVFNTLHSELQDYKNDFIYEHLKPVVRTLLFLYDSMEQFDGEMAQHERSGADERRGVSPAVVRQNIKFFHEQLIEALRICEVVPMQKPEGVFDPKLHKAVDITPVESELENTIQRVVRIGWYLNGRMFRPAEVVVGKSTEEYNAQIWSQGRGKNDDKTGA